MAKFTDKKGREWVLELDGFLIRDVRKECEGLDLNQPQDAAPIFIKDKVRLVETLWILCREQAKARTPSIDYREFAKGIVNETLTGAETALIECMNDFYPSHIREVLKAVVAEQTELMSLALENLSTLTSDTTLKERRRKALSSRLARELTRLDSIGDSPATSE